MKVRPRILLFGRYGQVGWEVERLLATRADLIALDQGDVDFTEPGGLAAAVDKIAPDVVVNAAAYTAVDEAESEPELAHAVNATAPGVIAERCARRGALLVHYSTDYVFDGAATVPYRETDASAPLGIYGRTKLDGERRVAAAGGRWVVLRTSWVFGVRGKNFLLTMRRLFIEREEVRVVDDQYGAPTSSRYLAEATARVISTVRSQLASGVFHCSASGVTSWYGFASLLHAMDVRPQRRCSRVIPVSTAEYPTPARRPRWSVLDSRLAQRTFGITPRPWDELVREAMDELAAQPPGASPGES